MKKNVTVETDITLNPLELLQEIVQGRLFLTLGFFKRYGIYVAFVTVLMLMYISNKYTHMSEMAQTETLRKELNNAKTDFVGASANYNSHIVESKMIEMVREKGLDLRTPDEPPYLLNND